STSDVDVQPVSPTRRKLPKTPDQPSQTTFMGDIGIQIWFDHSRNDLVITLLSARGLRRRTPSGNLPCALAKLRLVPHSGFGARETKAADPGTTPEWNKTFIFPSISADKLLEKSLEVTVWDQSPTGQKILLGGTEIPLRKTDLSDCPEWYPLTSNQLPPSSPSSTQKTTPSGMSGHDMTVRKTVNQSTDVFHSFSVLHPEDAWNRIQQTPPDGASAHKSASPCESRSSRSTPPSRKNSMQLTSRDSLPGSLCTTRSNAGRFQIEKQAQESDEEGGRIQEMDVETSSDTDTVAY
ncbi:regulating synaptic membrane exocytosis protein 1-like, partial [Limulus polyphemus]|uniref:Regulating synaptic membrane exocytosis protein 1-like n=1 Tax=Limulus polyphemus TaxID=6850 RepID=A0ABM1SNP2_LIMPO